jgi:hypothetical protein
MEKLREIKMDTQTEFLHKFKYMRIYDKFFILKQLTLANVTLPKVPYYARGKLTAHFLWKHKQSETRPVRQM